MLFFSIKIGRIYNTSLIMGAGEEAFSHTAGGR